jgi:hypothetical protein
MNGKMSLAALTFLPITIAHYYSKVFFRSENNSISELTGLVHSPDKPETKRIWLIREIPNP